MGQTIRRGGKGVRRVAATRGAKAKVQTARKQTGTAIGHALRVQPFSEETLHRIMLTAILGTAAVVTWTVANIAGVPALAEAQVARLSHQAGFDVKHVEVRGVKRMNQQTIYERVLGQRDQAMSRLDVAGLRDGLLGLPWIKDARVSRQLPDTLVVDVVERTPHGVLRKGDQLMLIDETGHELEPVSAAKARGLFVLTGEGAAARVPDLNRLLDAAPALKPQVSEAEWIGNRRWNLTFKTGQVLALPEGEDEAAAALLEFARLDGVNRLLGGKIASFDMRAKDRTYMLVPGHAEEMAKDAADKVKAKAAAKAARAAAKE